MLTGLREQEDCTASAAVCCRPSSGTSQSSLKGTVSLQGRVIPTILNALKNPQNGTSREIFGNKPLKDHIVVLHVLAYLLQITYTLVHLTVIACRQLFCKSSPEFNIHFTVCFTVQLLLYCTVYSIPPYDILFVFH